MYIPTPKVPAFALMGALSLIPGCGLEGLGGPPPGSLQPMMIEQCPESDTQQIADGVFAFRRGLYSTMFIAGKGGVIAFDPLSQEAPCLDRAIRRFAPGLLVEHLFYSHEDQDHIAGARALPLSPAVRVYAHKQTAEALKRAGASPDDVVPVTDPLDVNRDGSGQPMTLTLLERRLSLYYFGPTKGSGNLLMVVPDAQVAMLSDVLMAGTVPGMLLASTSPQGVMRTLSELDRLPVRTVVTGHGPPASHADVTQTLGYWTSYVSQAQAALRRTPVVLTDKEALDGAPVLKIQPQLPLKEVVDALRPYYGGRIGFEQWGPSGFDFAYLYLTGESAEPLPLRAGNAPKQAVRWEKVGEGVFSAQVGAYGSLIIDPDPDAKEALVVVDPLGENAEVLRGLLRTNMPGRRVGHVIYSHPHNDHVAHADTLCDGSLQGVHIYAHENAARDLRERRNPTVAPPTDVVLGAGTDLHIGAQTIQLRWFGPSHSDGNLIIHVPSARVAMGVGLVQRGAMPGLLSVTMDPGGLYRALAGMDALGAEVYLTGQGGWMLRKEFQGMVAAARDLLVDSAAAMKTDTLDQSVPLSTPVGPALRSFVDAVGGKVQQSLVGAYPTLQVLPAGAVNLGDLGVSYCTGRAASPGDCTLNN